MGGLNLPSPVPTPMYYDSSLIDQFDEKLSLWSDVKFFEWRYLFYFITIGLLVKKGNNEKLKNYISINQGFSLYTSNPM